MTSASRGKSLSRSLCPAAPWLRRGSPLLAPAADASAEEPRSRLPAPCQPCQLQPSAAGTLQGRDPAHIPAILVTAMPVLAVGMRQQRCRRHKPLQKSTSNSTALQASLQIYLWASRKDSIPTGKRMMDFSFSSFFPFFFFPPRQYPHPLFPKNG